MIARMLAHDIRNPAEEGGVVYVNGVASQGAAAICGFGFRATASCGICESSGPRLKPWREKGGRM